jgi:hypothetical protein
LAASQAPRAEARQRTALVAVTQHRAHALPGANPALVRHAQERAQSLQNRIADRITAFAGSMWFVYIHIASPSSIRRRAWVKTKNRDYWRYPEELQSLRRAIEAACSREKFDLVR